MNTLKQLAIVFKHKKLTLENAKKLGIDVNKLINLKLISLCTHITENTVKKDNVPKYAYKFKFLRRKYKIDVTFTESSEISITDNGIKFIKKSVKKDEEEIVKKYDNKEADDEL
jgi:hypothetical protein